MKQPTNKPVINPFEKLDSTPPKIESHVASPHPVFKEIPQVGNNATKLDLGKLNEAYAKQDAGSIKKLQEGLAPEQIPGSFKLQFFRKYRKEEEEYYQKRKREEEEKKQREELEEQEKKKKDEEARLASQGGELPKGKKRKSIFVKMKDKASTLLPLEMRPGGGKQ